MNKNVFAAAAIMFGMLTASCTTIPRFVLNRDDSRIKVNGKDSGYRVSDAAPVGPKVASFVGNMECELKKAVNSTTLLPFYTNDGKLSTKNHTADPARSYNLHNIFDEIEYVGEASFTLDVVDTSQFNPLGIATKPLAAASGIYPATSAVLSVGGTLSEAPHRYIQFDQSIDFDRLIDRKCAESDDAAHSGSELAGNLGLEEFLATGLIASSMSDIAIFPAGEERNQKIKEIDDRENRFGQISSQIDFTIVENVNGGPAWTTRYLKGPNGNSQGLLNLNRQVKDTLLITVAPLCIKRKGTKNDKIPGRMDYKGNEALVDGTPGWANYLPSCDELNEPEKESENQNGSVNVRVSGGVNVNISVNGNVSVNGRGDGSGNKNKNRDRNGKKDRHRGKNGNGNGGDENTDESESTEGNENAGGGASAARNSGKVSKFNELFMFNHRLNNF